MRLQCRGRLRRDDARAIGTNRDTDVQSNGVSRCDTIPFPDACADTNATAGGGDRRGKPGGCRKGRRERRPCEWTSSLG
jgi:hypothetical protein